MHLMEIFTTSFSLEQVINTLNLGSTLFFILTLLTFCLLDNGILHKSFVYEGDVHIIEEIQLLKNSEPVKNLLLSSKVSHFIEIVSLSDTAAKITFDCSPQTQSIYAGSDSGVVQLNTFFCGKYMSCTDCILARDPYCAWDPHTNGCVNTVAHRER